MMSGANSKRRGLCRHPRLKLGVTTDPASEFATAPDGPALPRGFFLS